MAKIKYTKNELKLQKDNLKRFTRYLPTLELKKQQLLVEIRTIQGAVEKLEAEAKELEQEVSNWADVFAEDIDLHSMFSVKQVLTDTGNIAGIDIPLFKDVIFEDYEYDFFTTPIWVDKALEVTKSQIRRIAELDILHRQQEIIREELRITVQRIKLFEEVKIPESKENIRVIRIFLGDQMTAAVVRGKIAKTKLESKKKQEAHQ
ncbi:MAG: V-type ATP synthase subunit D [Desulfatiglans sp.]|jgi:V/A-type H+-transporting ATPase subunit D|nr:V-type ATP synthase subunit D [Desulfatiglans sp.]